MTVHCSCHRVVVASLAHWEKPLGESIWSEKQEKTMSSFVQVPVDSHFPIQNLPFGIFSRKHLPTSRSVGVAIGDFVLDLAVLSEAGLFRGPYLQNGACFNQATTPLCCLTIELCFSLYGRKEKGIRPQQDECPRWNVTRHSGIPPRLYAPRPWSMAGSSEHTNATAFRKRRNLARQSRTA
jgi:Fumarylacetoacetase N-terminal